jgi:non-heme chloroperoxidase
MFRRDVLKTAATWLAGASLSKAAGRHAAAAAIGSHSHHGERPAARHAEQVADANARQTAATRPPFIEASDGTRLFYRAWGPDSSSRSSSGTSSGSSTTAPASAAPAIVFVPPWAMTCDWFEYQMTYLASQGLRCVSYDRRGHGRSDEPGRGYEFTTLAADLATLIDRLDLHNVTLVGHSMGAGEVVRYLTLHGPARIARIVLIAPITPFPLKTPDNPDGGDRSVMEAGRARLAHDRPGQIAQAAPAFFGTDVNPTVSPAMLQWWIDMLVEQCSLKVMIDLHRMFTETDFREDLKKITVPTLVIHGDHDTSTRLDVTGRKTAQLIAGSRLIVYENAAHALPVTHIDRLNADLLAFAKS